MTGQFNWEAPPLDPEDARLIDAYVIIGRPVDDLPYTEEFEKLRRLLNVEDSAEGRQLIFRRLLRLRKMGRLPRMGVIAG